MTAGAVLQPIARSQSSVNVKFASQQRVLPPSSCAGCKALWQLQLRHPGYDQSCGVSSEQRSAVHRLLRHSGSGGNQRLAQRRFIQSAACGAGAGHESNPAQAAETYPSLEGRNILITGSGRGIGFHTAQRLAGLGATVWVADMGTDAAPAAVRSILQELPRADVRAAPPLDLGAQGRVDAFAEAFRGRLRGQPLDVLVNNAGANFMGAEPWFTEQGVAGLPQVNVLGPYTLTRLLQGALLAAPSPRIVNVASVMHRKAALPADLDLFLRDWWGGGSYRNCKLAVVLLTQELQRRWGPAGLTAVAADPGASASRIWATSRLLGRPPLSWLLPAIFAPPSDAAATVIHAAAAQSSKPGGYYARGLFASAPVLAGGSGAAVGKLSGLYSVADWPLRRLSGRRLASRMQEVPIAPAAQDVELAGRLWDLLADTAGLPRDCGVSGNLLTEAAGQPVSALSS